jgi:formimidoylglutamate deiminase
MSETRQLFAGHALLPDGWAQQVLLGWGAAGRLTQVDANVACPPGVARSHGPVLPGMPNLHSHAFQRAFAGLTEYRAKAQDDFWSWRDLMYRFAGAITPEQLEDIATWLYVEMLEAGYTAVCEFHYLHNDAEGRPYADDAALSRCLLRAAHRAGIGMTLLPVLYQHSGFGGLPPARGQRRFIRSTESLLRLIESLRAECAASGARVGLAPHSLRAVTPDSLQEALAGLQGMDSGAPVHIHIAEQTREVEDCIAWSGQRPVAWLLAHAPVDTRWCLVHATHVDEAELHGIVQTGAVAGLCPSTEANLGDGVFPAVAHVTRGGRYGIGSDSHTCVSVAEELMLLEYSQRLTLRRRNALATPAQPQTAAALYLATVAGGAQASGRAIAGLAVGHQADLIVLNPDHVALTGLEASMQLSVHVFASHRNSAVHEVWQAGQRRVRGGSHSSRDEARTRFVAARTALLTPSH